MNLSRFDVGGTVAGDEKNLTAYVFSDRGIYRPGDQLNLGVIVKSYDWTASLKGLPLELRMTNPRGQVVHEEKLTLNQEGFVDAKAALAETATTGEYDIGIYLVGKNRTERWLGNGQVKVEEFLPDRMKIQAELNRESKEGWIQPRELQVEVRLANLYGAAAVGRKIQTELTLRPAVFSFPRYPDFSFHDPDWKASQARRVVQESLKETQTDPQGAAVLALDLERFGQGVYALNYLVRGFEAEGGRSVAGGGKHFGFSAGLSHRHQAGWGFELPAVEESA
ncbi:MAG: hypothetical protein HC904_01625 [Blastochloris sp.]|nr:hypothetical protein [Blastochloris sp.]